MMQAGLDAPDEHLAAQRGMTTRKFLQATAGLRARAHQLWKEEHMELQRGEELMAISGVPCTARAQQPLLDQAGMPSTPGLSFGYAMPAAPLPLNSPTESSDFGAAIAALGFNLGDMEPLSTGTGALASAGRSGHHHQAAAPSTAVPTWTSGPPSHAQAAVPPPHLYHQQQQQQHYTYHPQGLGVHHDAEAFIYFPQQGCWNTAGGSTGPGMPRPKLPSGNFTAGPGGGVQQKDSGGLPPAYLFPTDGSYPGVSSPWSYAL